MRYTIHVKIGDFEFIEAEVEGTPQDAMDEVRAIQRQLQPSTGLPAKEWNALKKEYFTREFMEGDPGDLEKLSAAQKFWVNETKKTIKALKEEQLQQEIRAEVEQEKS